MASGFLKQTSNLISNNQRATSNANVSQTQKMVLQQDEERKIRSKLKDIDDILTRECFFCGALLIDMINNDVEPKVEENEEDEDLEQEKEKEENKASMVEDEWAIC